MISAKEAKILQYNNKKLRESKKQVLLNADLEYINDQIETVCTESDRTSVSISKFDFSSSLIDLVPHLKNLDYKVTHNLSDIVISWE